MSGRAAERPLPGMLLMLGFCIVAPLGDATARLAGETLPVAPRLAARFALQMLLLVPLVALAPCGRGKAASCWP